MSGQGSSLLDHSVEGIDVSADDWYSDAWVPTSDEVIGLGLDAAEEATVRLGRDAAAQMSAIRQVLVDAARYPEVYVHDPTAKDAVDFAVRGAVFDLATRLRMSETTVRNLGYQAEILISRLPGVWQDFRDGLVPIPNARTAAETVTTLPHDDPGLWAVFDAEATPLAVELNPARFRDRVRRIRERLHPRPVTERHRDATQGRRVEIEHGPDGMSWLALYAPSHQLQRIRVRIDAATAKIATAADETRTRDQIAADVTADILLGTATPPSTQVSVGVLVPVLTLLGGDEPATLEGVGPIDPATARELCAGAPSFFRLLTHPVSGAILTLDRTRYRPPKDLQRWIRIRDPLCTAPGCGRRSADCDIDHTLDAARDGPTNDTNLGPMCEPHHRVKHRTKWDIRWITDRRVWTSPTGPSYDVDTPPF
jgi:hypothetical protein